MESSPLINTKNLNVFCGQESMKQRDDLLKNNYHGQIENLIWFQILFIKINLGKFNIEKQREFN